jgi:hypothetical protein
MVRECAKFSLCNARTQQRRYQPSIGHPPITPRTCVPQDDVGLHGPVDVAGADDPVREGAGGSSGPRRGDPRRRGGPGQGVGEGPLRCRRHTISTGSIPPRGPLCTTVVWKNDATMQTMLGIRKAFGCYDRPLFVGTCRHVVERQSPLPIKDVVCVCGGGRCDGRPTIKRALTVNFDGRAGPVDSSRLGRALVPSTPIRRPANAHPSPAAILG